MELKVHINVFRLVNIEDKMSYAHKIRSDLRKKYSNLIDFTLAYQTVK